MVAESTPTPKLAYTLNEAAEALGISRATLGRLVRRGDLRVSRLGWRTARVSHEALVDLLRSKEETGRRTVPGKDGGEAKP